MSEQGYALIHRTLLGHPAFRNDGEAMAFAWMVVRASWRDVRVRYKGRPVSLSRGQLAISVRDLAERLDRPKGWAERLLKRLKSETMIETHSETGVLVVTICNYDDYQSNPNNGETVRETVGETRAGQPQDSRRTQNKEGNKGIREEEEPDGSSLTRADDRQQVIDHWNVMASANGLSQCRLTERRVRAIKARLKDNGLSEIQQAIDRIPRSSFLLGRKQNSDWQADIDFLLRPDSVTKILEGKYDDRPSTGNQHPSRRGGPDAYRRAVQGAAGFGGPPPDAR